MDHRTAPSYEVSLRAIGSYLDRQDARNVHVLEAPTGFLVRFENRGDDVRGELVCFDYKDVRPSGPEVDWLRNIKLPSGRSRSYEVLLKAVGRQLDEIQAACILLDELPESLMISYEFDDPTRGFFLRKRMALANERDLEQLVKEVRSHRLRLRGGTPTVRWEPTPNGYVPPKR